MRLFPDARRRPAGPSEDGRPRRATVIAVALVLGAAAVGPAAYAEGHHHGHHRGKASGLRHTAHEVHHKIHRVSGDLDDVSHQVLRLTTRLHTAQARLRTAHKALWRTQRELASAERTAARLQGQLHTAQTQLDAAVTQVKAAQAKVDAQRTLTRNTIIGFASEGDPRLATLASYLRAGTMSDLLMSQTGNELVLGEETSVLADLQTAEADLQATQTRVEAARDRVRTRTTAAQHTVTRVRGLRNRAAASKRRVAALVRSAWRDRHAAARARRHDMAKLRYLKAREARLQRRILAATIHDRNRHVGHLRGMFLPPVAHSYITSPYGWRIHPIYHYWGLHDGDDFHAPCGVPEIAVGSGKVISRYYSSVWGNRLYLDLGRINGHRFVAIYNHISSYRSHVGERVRAGQILARAGTTGWSTACHLHFTLMRDGRAINPAPYLGF